MAADRDDEVGYKRPPKATRFRKGHSGNPSGRPKGSRTLATIVARATQERVVVTENGRRRRITKLDVAIKQLVNKAAAGDLRCLKELLRLVLEARIAGNSGQNAPAATSEADRKVMEMLRARILGAIEKDRPND